MGHFIDCLVHGFNDGGREGFGDVADAMRMILAVGFSRAKATTRRPISGRGSRLLV